MNPQLTINASKEDVEELANMLATVLIEEAHVEYVEVEVIDLDTLASSIAGILDPFGQLKEWLEDLLETIASWIVSGVEALLDTVKSALSDLINMAISGIDGLASTVSGLWDYIVASFTSVLDAVTALGSAVYGYILNVLDAVSEAVSTIANAISSAVSTIVSEIGNIAYEIVSAVSSIIETIVDAVSSFFTALGEAVSKGFEAVFSGLQTVGVMVSKLLEPTFWAEVLKPVTGFISDVVSKIVDTIGGFFSTLGEAVSKGFETVISSLQSVWSLVSKLLTPEFWSEAFKPVVDFIVDNIVTPFVGMVTKILDSVVKGLDLVSERLMGFINALTNLPMWFEQHIVKPFKEFLEPIFSPLAESVKAVVEPLTKLGESLANIFTDPSKIIEGLRGFAETAWKVISNIGSFLVEAVIEAIKSFVGAVVSAFKTVAKIGAEVCKTFYTALGSVLQSITKPIVSPASPVLVESFAKQISDIYSFSFVSIEQFIKWMMNIDPEKLIEKPISWLYMLVTAMVPALAVYHFARTFLKSVFKAIPNPEVSLEPLGLGYKFKVRLRSFFEELARLLDRTMPDVARYLLIGHMIWWTEPTRALTRYLLTSSLTVTLPPIGLTLESVRRRLLTGMIDDLYNFIETQLRMGGINVKYVERIYGLDRKTVELFNKKLEESANVFPEYRIPKFIPEKTVEKGMIVFKDRFETERYIPTSLIFTLPSPETLARWLVRDIFIVPSHYEGVVTAIGVFPDMARLQYMYSFMYPPPEKLWDFTMRGISGLLWFRPPEKIRKVFEQEAKWLNAGVPLAPEELNYKPKELFTALNWFMKWRQYSNFSWFRKEIERYGIDFTADSWLILDATADIPTKIDVRWMTKWAIFEEMSGKGIGVKTPAKEFTKILEDTAKSKEVTMDLTLMCRLLQATGLHPYYVPVTAVAEAINALTDERTYVRTGFINLFKEGFFTYEILDELLKGFVIASFKVSYFDMEKYDWVTKWINIPVRFLPAERRLLELRAVFDRSLDVLRDYMRMLGRGVSYLIFEPDEAISMLKKYVGEVMNPWFTGEVKKITGKELKLAIDEAWVKAYTEYFKQLREMETVVRARYYSRYLIYHIIRRFERGFYTKEEAEKLISTIVERLKESTLFEELMLMVSDFTASAYVRELLADAVISQLKRRKISKSEAIEKLVKLGLDESVAEALVEAKATPYSISLTSLGTLLEVVPEALNYSVKSLPLFGFNKEEYGHWVRYVLRKPFKDELTLIRSRIYGALARGVSAEELVDVLSKYAVYFKVKDLNVEVEYGDVAKKLVEFYNAYSGVFEAYAISANEWVMFNLIAELERTVEGAREYVPTPSQLATIAEVVPEARLLTKDVLTIRRVPAKFAPIWAKYIDIRPLIEEIRTLFRRVERLYTYFYIKPEDFAKVLETIKPFGYEDREITLMLWSADFEKIYRAFDNVIGTPRELVTMAEYSPIARRFALGQVYKMIDALPVDAETKELLKAMWEEYIRVRPVSGEVSRYVTELISDYAYGVIDREALEKELNELKDWGLDDIEVELYLRLAEKRKARYAIRRQMGLPYYS